MDTEGYFYVIVVDLKLTPSSLNIFGFFIFAYNSYRFKTNAFLLKYFLVLYNKRKLKANASILEYFPVSLAG